MRVDLSRRNTLLQPGTQGKEEWVSGFSVVVVSFCFLYFIFFFKLYSVFRSSALSLPQKTVNAFSTLTRGKESYSRD